MRRVSTFNPAGGTCDMTAPPHGRGFTVPLAGLLVGRTAPFDLVSPCGLDGDALPAVFVPAGDTLTRTHLLRMEWEGLYGQLAELMRLVAFSPRAARAALPRPLDLHGSSRDSASPR